MKQALSAKAAITSLTALFALGTLAGSVGASPSSRYLRRLPREAACNGQWHISPSIDVAAKFGDYNSLNAVAALSKSDVWAVGQFHHFSTNSHDQTLAELWNGHHWTVVSTPNSTQPDNLLTGVAAVASNDVWAVGYETALSGNYETLVEHWDGNAWSIVQGGTFTGLLTSASATGTSDVWAVGSTNYVGQGLIEHWNGTAWSETLLPGAEYLRSITAIAPNDVWAVGQKSTRKGSGEGDHTYTVHYDGTRWTHVPSPSPLKLHPLDQNWLTSVTAVSTNDVWAVGVTRDTDYGILDATLSEHWDGTRWTVVSTPDPGGTSNYNDFWGAVAVSTTDVWTVGEVGQITFSPLSAQWTGSQWSVVATPSIQGSLLGVTRDNATGLWATGNRVQGSGSNVYNGTLVEHLCT